ncbi:MFS transporter [Cereibacter sphaeroides]|uniref:MFS transporter n=1 Tax=Rhodobacterales TaxID=204455 RepID=UPI000BBEF367|nr:MULTISPECIES: MFS transporter [Paracoccaceae]MCE6953212.1 MFS transporter [Cereibacter sphaeroides]
MFSFIDDIPTLEQIKARVRDDIKKYKYDEYWNNSRIVQKGRELLNDEELKIDPATWIWKRMPSKEELAARRDKDIATIWKYRVQIGGFLSGALLVMVLGAFATSGNFGGASDANNRPSVVYPIE